VATLASPAPRGTLTRYGVAVASSGAAGALTLLLGPALEINPFPLFLAAVTLSALAGGLGPGLLATVASVALLDFLFFAPHYTLTLHYASDLANLIVFALVALLIGSLNARLRAARERAEVARVEAERLVLAQRDLERQKDEFLANVSHDLRTPLTAIKHSIEVVLANEPRETPRPLHELLLNISESADRMAALVEDLLDLVRLRAGKLRLHAVPCDLRALATRAAGAVESLATQRGQRLVVDLPPEPLVVKADPVRLERAVLNLLGNAQKYGRAGGEVRLRVSDAADDALVAVTDDGPGIPPQEQALIFERFYRADSEMTRQHGGSGLGLPIARALVELHGGRIWVESEPGAGATFWIALPRAGVA
jgi:signal transduction histidine kinase